MMDIKSTCHKYNDLVVKILLIFVCILNPSKNNGSVCNAFSIVDQRGSKIGRKPSMMGKEMKIRDVSGLRSYSSSVAVSRTLISTLRSKSDDKNDVDVDIENDNQGLILPGLPPIGFSSYDQEKQSDDGNDDNIGDGSTKVGYVGTDKFELQYTCKICETRNSHKVSRIAYRQGVVIAVCKGCKSKHLIADNLGWSNYIGGFDGETNIEKYLEAQGRGDEVNRVTEEVFDLEKILNIEDDSNSNADNEGEHFE